MEPEVTLAHATLDDKYTLTSGRVFLNGLQALVRLPMMQRERDLASGHNTAGFISGYRGSPLGSYDQQLSRANRFLEQHHVVFKPGVNEDLAATAVWGTQQVGLDGEGKYDGVFAIWYGKGPGVDRCGDAFRHGNLAGSSALGGVLMLLGDDHTCESSTTAHQSEYAMVDAMVPILNPAGVQEILDYGLFGWALSRYSGCWVALKCVHDTVEASASVDINPTRVRVVIPSDFEMPADTLNIRWPDSPQQQEARLHNYKLEAARAFCRANRLDRLVLDSSNARIGVITTGKSYLDVRQALDDLGIDEPRARRLGLRLYKIAMPWPLEPLRLETFCKGLDLVIVVEEKRGLIETQLKEIMYGKATAPRVIGKRDEHGAELFPSAGRLDANQIANVIGRRILHHTADEQVATRLEALDQLKRESSSPAPIVRLPYFCPGCPHNSSTVVPEGSRALAGIGCHYMAQWMDRDTARFTQMGAEGASWIGEALFSTRDHMFQNVGDGTYYHSGLLAIRAAVAADTNITFKILYNDAVAMTGGQAVDGPLTVPQITQQVYAEGARRIAVVTDEPHKYGRHTRFAPGVSVHQRDELDAVQRELRQIEGTTVLVYDQMCAAEKRRRRKRGLYPDPAMRVFINDAVCEGCGDCGIVSNCVAIVPLETEWGRKRAIDQSVCNKDFSCIKGFCPSFVTVHGAHLKKGTAVATQDLDDSMLAVLPEPELPALETPYPIVITGVGGTGVITIGALLGMAAHLENKGCSILDMTGLAQKGGAVVSHLRIARRPEEIQATRIAAGGARLLLGCDLIVAAGNEALKTVRRGTTKVVANSHEMMTGDFTRHADLAFPGAALMQAIVNAGGADHVDFVDATRLATALLGDSIATNLFMTGYAYQKGLIPVSAAAIERAIELNEAAVEMNKQAFLWGRRAATDPTAVKRLLKPATPEILSKSLEEVIAQRVRFLTDYQDAAYARRYRDFVERVRHMESKKAKGRSELSEAVARCYFKLMAYKDEYEVARLYTNGEFLKKLDEQFEGDFTLQFYLASPLFARRDRNTGALDKRSYGQWVLTLFKYLAKLKRLRGTKLDIFGYTRERRIERQLLQDYEALVDELLDGLDAENHRLSVEIAQLPEHIRGFGHVKQGHLNEVKRRQAELLTAYRESTRRPQAA